MDKALFTKEQLLRSKDFANRRDILSVLVADGETLTKDEAAKRINKFMKGKVR